MFVKDCMSRKIIATIYDDKLSMQRSLELLGAVSRADFGDFKKDCIWEMTSGHCVKVDKTALKNGWKFDIFKKGSK